MKKEKRNNGRNGGVGNHRCIGNCTLPVHDSFITHEFITSRLARNRYQLGKRFRRKAIATIREKYGDDRSEDYSFGEEEEPDQLLSICPFFLLS